MENYAQNIRSYIGQNIKPRTNVALTISELKHFKI